MLQSQSSTAPFLNSISRYSLYFLLVFSPLARGSVQQWALAVMMMAVVTGLAVLLMRKSLNWDWQWIKTPLDRPLIALLALCFVSLVFSVHRGISVRAMALLLCYPVVFYLVIHTTDTRERLRQIVYIIIGVALFLSVFGIFKRFGVNPFPWWEYGELKYKPDFLAATYGNHNHLAGYLEMALPLLLGLFLKGYRWSRVFMMLYITFLLIAAQVLSLSRGGWIASLLGLSFMAAALMADSRFQSRKLLYAIVGGAVFSALLILASTPVVERMKSVMEMEEEASFHSRVVAWGGVNRMIGDHPLAGTGPGTFADVFTQYQPPGLGARFKMAHNDYLQFVADGGLLVIPIIIWLAFALYKKGFGKLKNPSRLIRGITLGAMTGITSILMHSIIDFNLHIPANALLFTVLAALVVMPVPRRA